MLETIREFGLEQLAARGEETAARDAHAAYLLALATEAEPHLIGPDQVAWLERIERELPNVRDALGWLLVQGRAEDGLRLAAAPGRFWWRRGYLGEGRFWLDAFLALPSSGGATSVRVRALLVAGDIAAWQKDREQAAARHGEAAALARTLGDTWGLAMALYGLGSDSVDQDVPAEAAPFLAESVALFNEIGDTWGAALARGKQGDAALALGDHDGAAACLEEALAVFRERQDGRFVAGVLDGLGQLALTRGDVAGARRAYAESMALSVMLGDKTAIAWGLMGMAGTAGLAGRAETAARLLGAAATLREALGAQLGPSEWAIHDQIESRSRAVLGPAFAAAWEAGVAIPLAEALAEATAVARGESDGETRAAGELFAPAGVSLPSLSDRLTPRQVDVLRLMAEGLSDSEIAWQLRISPRTASNHVAAILAKLGVHTRQSAIHAASELGLI
jgi:DNA-binding CsgD family transcriptional regulator